MGRLVWWAQWWGRLGSSKWVKPCVGTFQSSYEPKKHQLYAQTSLESLRDVLLTLGSISDPYLPSSALHEPHCLDHDFKLMVNKTCSGKLNHLAKPGNATVRTWVVHECSYQLGQ